MLLSGCGAVTPVPQFSQTKPSTVFPFETSTPIATASSQTGIIEPDNVYKLQIIDKWEKGNVYGVVLSPDQTEIAVSTSAGVYIYGFESLQEKKFIDFFNNAQPINTRLHQIELLPGFGKKHMKEILSAREEKPFESFEDIRSRVSNLPDPKKAIEKRILEELLEEQRYNLFVR